MSAPKHTPGQCGAVFRAGVNQPVSCALRPNHTGGHRTWQQVADERAEFLEQNVELENEKLELLKAAEFALQSIDAAELQVPMAIERLKSAIAKARSAQ